MVKVITYGTYDMLHYGHLRLLERAKSLGDFLIVGITSDDYDKTRGKINLQQSLMERVEAVRATGIADEIIIEEYEGQKIDDIRRYDVDIFTVGSDWEGYFDYLNEYCKVIYLPRTEGISSTGIRQDKRSTKLGIIGDSEFINKIIRESSVVNGVHITSVFSNRLDILSSIEDENIKTATGNIEDYYETVDCVYIRSVPELHYLQIKKALEMGKHVLCESPITVDKKQCEELLDFAKRRNIVLMEAIKTAYATAYLRLLVLLKTGVIGQVVSVDATCTSMREKTDYEWDYLYEWGPTALLPIFQVLGTDYNDCRIASRYNSKDSFDFTKISFEYNHAVASLKIGNGVKSEGDLIISGTKGYIYVPAPWWKTDYFEARFENMHNNKRFFFQLDGEGIRYELVEFIRAIERGKKNFCIEEDVTLKIAEVMELAKDTNRLVII